MANYIKYQKKVLKHLCIWGQMTSEEKTAFMNSSTEFEVDRIKRNMMDKYF